MLHKPIFLHPKETHFKKVSSILIHFFIFPAKYYFSTDSSIKTLQRPLPSNTNQTHEDPTSLSFSDTAKSVQLKHSHRSDINTGEFLSKYSLKDYIFRLSNISPEIVRSFWRVPCLKPADVLELLQGFESNSEKYEIEVRKVESLWGIFKWASGQNREFYHLPQSCKIMASMLVRVGLCKEAEYVLSKRESGGILLDCEEIFSNLMERYVEEFELDRAVSIYERMKGSSLVPSLSCFEAFLKYLVELNETYLLYLVYMDILKIGIEKGLKDRSIHDNVIRLLCIDGKVQEARDLVRKVMVGGIEPSKLVVDAISFGYCEKKDYDDILGFLAEIKIAPDTLLGNKILFSLCRSFGVEEASIFMQNLEELGFCPDEITFGIFIGCSCREGNVRDAFLYVSDCLSRSLKLHLYSYNALLSGILKEGMWKHSRDLLVEMRDMGVTPVLSTFKVLLAGFCKARQFDEVKGVICQMVDKGLVKISSTEDPVSKAFMLLGLDPSTVKIKRDNDKGFPRSEFFDSLGNGFYFETDLDEYEKRIADVLDEAMIPDISSYILDNCHSRDVQATLHLIDDMAKWGQEMSLPAFSSLVVRLSGFPFSIKITDRVFEVMFKSVFQLDHKSLNILIQNYCKKGLSFKARSLMEGMVRRGQIIEITILSSLLLDLCKKGDLRSLRYCCSVARKFKWSPEVKAGTMVLGYLCKIKWLTEALYLLESMVFVDPCNKLEIFHSFLGDLCSHGFTCTAHALFKESSKQDPILDYIAYSHLFYGFFQEKKFIDAMRVSDIMLSMNLAPPLDVSIQLIPQLCRNNELEKAFALKDACLKEQPSAFLPLHCALIKGLLKFGKVEDAAWLFKDMISMTSVPEIDLFNELIQGYCRAKNLRKVEEILGFMVRTNLTISSSSYSSTVRLLCIEGNLSLSIRFKELMLYISKLPEMVLYNILIFHNSAMRNISVLDSLINEVRKKGLDFDETTYNYIVQGFSSCNITSCLFQYLMTMIGKGLKPSNRSLRRTIRSLCCNEEIDKALILSGEMELRGWMHGSVVQISISEALLNNGNFHEAVAFLDRIELKGLIPSNIPYDYLIKKFYKHGGLDEAVRLLNIMLQKGSSPDSISYDLMIHGFCHRHDLNRALDFHVEMLYRGLRPSMMSWDVLVRSLCGDGRVAEAEEIVKSMIQLGECPSREMFLCVIDTYRSQRNTSKTSQLLKVMQEKGYEPDFDTHWSVIRNLTGSFKKDDGNQKVSFLSRLLSDVGFTRKNSKSNMG